MLVFSSYINKFYLIKFKFNVIKSTFKSDYVNVKYKFAT